MQVLVVGLGVTGEAVARHAAREGWRAVVTEDTPEGPRFEERHRAVEALGGRIVAAPTRDELRVLVGQSDLVVPSPGVPVAHPVYALARAAGVPVRSEIELAAADAPVPVVAVTGTNGKTTVTTLAAEVVAASGLRAVAAGNIGRPLLDAVREDVDVVVAEVSSFQLQFTERFRPRVAVVLNLGQDHLDWHPTFEHYREAKARVFLNQGGDDLLVLNADDPEVAAFAGRAGGQVTTFSVGDDPAGWHVAGGHLRRPGGEPLVAVDDLPRRLPHDLANALAAAAAALHVGATASGAAAALRDFTGLPHRLTPVGEAGGVRFLDDSKATNPHATLQALQGLDSVVLLAGGRNKGLPLSDLARGADHVRAVVAFGEAASEVEDAFAGLRPVTRATSMRDAVAAAWHLSQPGDVVLLSPACASFDAYGSYAERGDDFAAEVRRLVADVGP